MRGTENHGAEAREAWRELGAASAREAQRRRWIRRVVLLALAALAGAGAWYYFRGPDRLPFGVTPIAEIVAAPARFDGREVTVQGVVAGTSEIRLSGNVQRSYVLNDDGAELVVVPAGPLPARGQSLQVTGTVAKPPPGQQLAPRLAETKRVRAPGR